MLSVAPYVYNSLILNTNLNEKMKKKKEKIIKDKKLSHFSSKSCYDYGISFNNDGDISYVLFSDHNFQLQIDL